jgi:hypothetical protein
MVWSQYVYEANNGFDHDASDDDEFCEDTPLNIEDWEVEYSEELYRMWNTIQTLLYDASIEHSGEFCDFVEFCFKEHDSDIGKVATDPWYEERLYHVWKHVRRTINDNGLHEDMMRGATFEHFLDFAKNYMSVY